MISNMLATHSVLFGFMPSYCVVVWSYAWRMSLQRANFGYLSTHYVTIIINMLWWMLSLLESELC
jgi:hypothetical protein